MKYIIKGLMILVLLTVVTGCGKRGAPMPPDPKTDHYGRVYPDPASY